jgi:uncharacterized SAM-binding protein YcdF (DUF218 family)
MPTETSRQQEDVDVFPARTNPVKRLMILLWRVIALGSVGLILVAIILAYTPIGMQIALAVGRTPGEKQLQHADAIVVLGGDPYRAVVAAELFRNKLAPRMVISGDPLRLRRALNTCGIPSEAVAVDAKPLITADHPHTLLDVEGIDRHSRLILVTSRFHPARVRMLFQRAGYDNFEVYSRDWEWLSRRKESILGAVGAVYLAYELGAFAKDAMFAR